jgi:mercuric ion transport protein
MNTLEQTKTRACDDSDNSRVTKARALGPSLLTFGGIAAAFSVASCCALPLLFFGLGISASWLASIALVAVPYRGALIVIAALLLVAGAVGLIHQQRAAMVCSPGTKCTPVSVRLLTLTGLVIGAALLWAGYVYV